MKFNFTLPLASSVLHSLTTKSTTVIRDQYNNLVEIPQKWADDMKHLEFNELLSSTIGPLALYFGWKKKHKEEFSELASGTLASSFVYGEPVTSLTAIVVLAYRYSKSKNSIPNGIISLKGGDLESELKHFNNFKVFEISKFFSDHFFQTKKILYIPFPN